MSPPRRRERRGRGPRGPLVPERPLPTSREVPLPAWRSRSERFADLVHDAVGEVHRRWAAQLGDLRVVVEDVPPPRDDAPAGGVVGDGPDGGIALAQARPGHLVVYRRPLELRAEDPEELAELVHEVVVEAVADLLGMDPDEVDPPQG